MVLKITTGYSPEYLLKEVATGRENYYTGAVAEGEPPGRWWGSGAELLGLRGLVEAQDMRAVYERFLDPRGEAFKDPQRWDEPDIATLGHTGRKYMSEDELYNAAVEREPDADAARRMELRLEAGKNARQNVAFFDMTFSVAKSITLLHTAFEAQQVAAQRAGDTERAAAWGEFRQAVEDAIWTGNNAALAYMNEHAGYSRVGRHGGSAGRWIDAPDWVVASFLQHDSREHDPQLHIHNGFLNRVRCADGTWRTVDSRALHKVKPAAAAVAERTTAERLTHTLGVIAAMRPDGKAREIVGVAQEAMDLISTRRRQVTAKTADLVEAFEARYGRAPNNLELDRLSQQATLMTRRAKSHTGETREQVLDRVDARLRADLDGGLAGVAHAALEAREQAPAVQDWSPREVIALALEDVRRAKSGWTEHDLTAAIERALPDYLGLPDGAAVADLLESLTAEGVKLANALDVPRPADELTPQELRLRNGRSVYEAPAARLYATPDQIHTERALVAATAARDGAAFPAHVARRYVEQLRESGIELGVDQAAAVAGVLTSGARVECLVGPAGTGKSFVVGALAHAWTDPEHVPAIPSGAGPARRVFGLATSQIATEVLAAEGLTARNVTRWLDTQARLAAGPGAGGPRPVDGDGAWRLHAGDLVVVDESAMTDTASLAAIFAHVKEAGAKLLLVGDHRQLAAIGAAGIMELLAEAGIRYELSEARRFTHEWEREASLRLREGDETVLDVYHRQGRLLDAGTRDEAEASAARAWLGDTLAGRDTVLLVDDNAAAARLSGQLRAELVRLGRVAEHGVPLVQGTVAGVGDRVQARWNGWDLAGIEGNRRGPINRETYQVTAVRDDGSLDVHLTTGTGPDGEPIGQRLLLPARYVAEHLDLAYASTVHAAQGRTTDTSHAVITSWTSLSALYVALSRGRDANTAHVATTSTVDDPARGRPDQTLHRNPLSLLAGILADRDPITRQSATAIAADTATAAASVATNGERFTDAATQAVTARTAHWLDELTATGALTGEQRTRLAAEDGATSLGRVLRRAELAGLDARQVLTDAVTERPLSGANNTTNVLVSRITDGGTRRFDPHGDSWSQWLPATGRPAWDAYLAGLAHAADQRAAVLGRETAEQAPAWAVEALGAVPAADDPARGDWERRTGIVAGYRELRGHDDPTDALGHAPAPARQAEAYAAYRAAWTALGRPEAQQSEHEMSTAQHLVRIRAWERERAWEPRYVGNDLAGTRQAADHHRHAATVRRAEAENSDQPDERARLEREARDAEALAATLDEQIVALEQQDAAWARHRAHTARTRAEADISRAIVADRDDEHEPRVTADEWLAAHGQALADDERHQVVTEADVDDRPAELDDRDAARALDNVAAVGESDLREVAATEPRPVDEDRIGVRTPDQSAAALDRAQRAIREIEAREVWERQAEQDERAAQLGRWHDEDQSTRDAADVDEAAPVLSDSAGYAPAARP